VICLTTTGRSESTSTASPQMSMARWPEGQQLYAARHRAELSAEEAACAVGVSVHTVGAVEAEKPVKPDVTAAMQGCALHCYAAELWCTRRL
jgi:DNA-binding XRE family transcriptional regulator